VATFDSISAGESSQQHACYTEHLANLMNIGKIQAKAVGIYQRGNHDHRRIITAIDGDEEVLRRIMTAIMTIPCSSDSNKSYWEHQRRLVHCLHMEVEIK
jgi:hypothetical protein